ncbi:unnamed protein product, partial [Closterium sp. NIES-53]
CGAWGAESWVAEPGGAEPGGAEPGGAEPGGAEPGGAEPGGTEPGAVLLVLEVLLLLLVPEVLVLAVLELLELVVLLRLLELVLLEVLLELLAVLELPVLLGLELLELLELELLGVLALVVLLALVHLRVLELVLLELGVLLALVLPLGVLVLTLLVLEALRGRGSTSFHSLSRFLVSRPLLPASPLPSPSPYTGPTGGLTERREPTSRPALPVRAACPSRRAPRPRPPAVPGTHQMALRPSIAPLRVPLPSPPQSSLLVLTNPESYSLRAASPTVPRLLATVVTDPSFAFTAASALVTELADFASCCRVDYATSLIAASESVCSPSVGGECALSTDVLEDR